MSNNLDEQSSSTRKEILYALTMNDSLSSGESNEKLLMILNKNSGLALYLHEFSKSSLDLHIISAFVSAMTSFMSAITGEKQSSWKTVYGSDSVILVEVGKWAIGILVVSRETSEARSILGGVTAEFEDCFAVLRDSDEIEGTAFREFDQFARTKLVDERITSRTLVLKRPEWRTLVSAFDLPSVAFSVSKILLCIEDSQTVKEIAEFQNLQIQEVIEIVAKAFWHNTVFLKFTPTENDILSLSEGASTILFQKTNPLNLTNASLNVIACFDGRTPFFHFTSSMDDNELKVLLDDMGTLVNKGFIQRISVERRRVLLKECILSLLSSRGASIIGHKEMKKIFAIVRREGRLHHPWISRVLLTDRIQAHCLLEESMTTNDLDDLANALEFFITRLGEQLSKRYVGWVVERMLCKIRNDCQASWTPHLAKLVS